MVPPAETGDDPDGIGTKPVGISAAVYNRLTQMRARMRAALGRRVTYSEVIERLLQSWDEHHGSDNEQ
jgi:hypothetical protein